MKHINIISKSFGVDKKKIKDNDRVDKFIWDSMTKINQKFSKAIDHTKLEKIVYFKDIDNLIEKTIRK
jgi:acyl carrier protein